MRIPCARNHSYTHWTPLRAERGASSAPERHTLRPHVIVRSAYPYMSGICMRLRPYAAAQTLTVKEGIARTRRPLAHK
eukprot:2286915-Prymnesium_polylepis.1